MKLFGEEVTDYIMKYSRSSDLDKLDSMCYERKENYMPPKKEDYVSFIIEKSNISHMGDFYGNINRLLYQYGIKASKVIKIVTSKSFYDYLLKLSSSNHLYYSSGFTSRPIYWSTDAEVTDTDDLYIIKIYYEKEEPKLYCRWDIPASFTPSIKKVIFNNPATIVFWSDGTKTVVKRQKGDRWDAEKGLAMAIVKKTVGYKKFNEILDKAERIK